MFDDPFAIRSALAPRFNADALRLVRRAVWVMDPLRGRILHANAAAVALWSAESMESLVARDFSAVSAAVRTRTASQMPLFAAGETVCERVTLYPGGRPTTCDLLISGVGCDLPGEEDRVVMLIEATPVEIAPGEVRALEALRHTGVLVTLYDEGGLALFRNPASHAAYPAEPHRFGSGYTQACEAAALWARAARDGQASGTLRALTPAGERWHGIDLRRAVDPATGCTGLLADERDVTGEVEAHARVEYAAMHDGLTGLANRAGFARALADAEAAPAGYSLFLLDLDRFKPVNDLYGHAAGDAVLVATAARLRAAAGPVGTVARIGGDEFALVDPRPASARTADRLAAALVEVVGRPTSFEGRQLRVGASVGHVSVEPGTPGGTALRRADIAMYEAKRAGRAGGWGGSELAA